MQKRVRKMNASRVCFSFSRIGYTPDSAICDIIDNSITAGAKNIHIIINKINEKANNNRLNNVKEYLIIDDGKGMSLTELDNALDLGSDDSMYGENSLSKFGMGLKSASFAQGQRLEVITCCDGKNIYKQYVDLDEIEDEYFSVIEEPSDVDKELIEKYWGEKKCGTIIRIGKIHQHNHPNINKTIGELQFKAGVIYYYYISDGLSIYLPNSLQPLEAVDPLFANEANENGNLDENTWDGKTVRWLKKPKNILLDSDTNTSGMIEMTMLPHPQVFKVDGISDKEIRDKYRIGANNYGFYVYRNKRLIAWANLFDGLIPRDQNYYAFRGRINIDETADDAFNIDVKKANISLSKDAMQTLEDYVSDYKRKCFKAWDNAYRKYKQLVKKDTNTLSNEIAENIESVDLLPHDVFSSNPEYDAEVQRREQSINEHYRKKIEGETIKRFKEESGGFYDEEHLTDKDISKTVAGEKGDFKNDKIFRVSTIEDNLLWEPYTDAEKDSCVRISQNHKFGRVVYEDNAENADLQVLYEILLLIMSNAETYTIKHYQKLKSDEIENLLATYRLNVSEMLAQICRESNVVLPPIDRESI